ncbi:MAG TPA: pitrilysin family protein [Thermoanaerobaculia bacterium]|nr:pitrilysin family protein [Thermoanaerobaculia bacterium]
MRAARAMIAGLMLAAHVATAQVAPPPPAPPRHVTLPEPAAKTLANGLRVIVVPKHDVPLASARLMVRSGSEQDPAALAGLASLTASLLTQGTKRRTAEQIARGVEALGGTLNATAGWDVSRVDVTVMSSKLEPALEFVADVVRNPTFRNDEVERLRAQAIDAVMVSLQEPLTLARLVASRLVYGGLPYGQSVNGTPQSLKRITRDRAAAFHERHYRPENAVLIIAGDVTPASAFAMAGKHFGSWKRRSGGVVKIELRSGGDPPEPRVVVVDMPDAGQAAVLVTRRGLRRVDPLYYAAIVTNSVLGGGYSARLNQEIRIKRGLSYGATSAFDLRREEGPFAAWTQTKNESASEVAGLIVEELNRLAESEIGEEELTPRKAVLTGGFARSLETTAGVVDRLAALALHGLPLDEIGKFGPGVQRVTSEAVRRFARAHLGGSTASIVIVGDARQFLEPLRKRFEEVEVIALEELDLDSAKLREAPPDP